MKKVYELFKKRGPPFNLEKEYFKLGGRDEV